MTKIGSDFLELTKDKHIGESDQERGVPFPPKQLPFDEGLPIITLPPIDKNETGHVTVSTAINNRHSLRKYSEEPLTLQELSYLLWCTQGVKLSPEDRPFTVRTVPSAGARHPFETYLAVNRVEGLEQGLYRYLALDHKLLQIKADRAFIDQLVNASFDQIFLKHAAVTFVWVAVPYRTAWRYGDRAYRYIFLDAGHVCENLYLAVQEIGCGTVAVDAYDDDAVNNLLGIDGLEQFAIYMAPVGKEPK